MGKYSILDGARADSAELRLLTLETEVEEGMAPHWTTHMLQLPIEIRRTGMIQSDDEFALDEHNGSLIVFYEKTFHIISYV